MSLKLFRLFIKTLTFILIIILLYNYYYYSYETNYVSIIKRKLTQLQILLNNKELNNNIPNYMTKEEVTINKTNKINACIFFLLNYDDLFDLIKTITQFEQNFNHKYNYPYVLVTDGEPFDDNFKQIIQKYTKSIIEFGLISKNEWSIPDFIDENKLKLSIEKLKFSVSYRHLCRYYSGFFWRHELTLKYDYYIRLDPHVSFPCEIKQDPFLTLIKNKYTYGFILAAPEDIRMIPTLWYNIRNYFNNSIKSDSLAINYISNDNGLTLSKSLCNFYNNFEIASFSLFRNDEYLKFFNYLDKSGGFYYERWGDAPVHTYYAILKLKFNQIYRFDLGYGHRLFNNKPKDNSKCDKDFNFNKKDKCVENWDKLVNLSYVFK